MSVAHIACIIVERLLEHGASIVVPEDGNLNVFFPMPGCGRRSDTTDEWQRGMTDGAYRELHRLLYLVPGGEAAAVAHIRAHPSTVYRDAVVA